MGRKEKREEIYSFIKDYITKYGYGPSVREICESVHLKSTATAHYHLRLLAEEGRILMQAGKKRAISLPRAETDSEAEVRGGSKAAKGGNPEAIPAPGRAIPETLPLERPRGAVPLVGTVAAGQPILAVENVEGYLPWDGGEDWFALRVKGESMKNAGILEGDKVIVRPQPTAENGEIVVALLGDEATVKRFSRKNGHIWLLPENEAFEPIDGDEAVILGLVRGVVREYA